MFSVKTSVGNEPAAVGIETEGRGVETETDSDGRVVPEKSGAVNPSGLGARCSSVVRAFAHGAMGRRIDPLWGGPIELFLIPATAPRLV